ncbi:MAG TPA: hypothetical protein VFZ80_07830, partial [Acidimicrobiia bacterium]
TSGFGQRCEKVRRAATAISERSTERGSTGQVEERRRRLAEDAFDERATLRDEEHRLEARLGELPELASREGALPQRRAAAQTNLTHTPSLPR